MPNIVAIIFIGDSVGGAFYSSFENIVGGNRFKYVVISIYYNEIIEELCKENLVRYDYVCLQPSAPSVPVILFKTFVLIRNLMPQIIQGNDLRSNLICCVIAKVLNLKQVWCQRSLLNGSWKTVLPFVFADHVIAPSKVVADSFHPSVRGKTKVIQNAINIHEISKRKCDKRKTIFVIGRVVPERGVEQLIQYFVNFLSQRTDPNIQKVIFVGFCHAEYHKHLMTLLPEKLQVYFSFMGFCKDPWRLVCEGDIVVNGCEKEAFGRTVWEFACYKCPIIVHKQNLEIIPPEFKGRFLSFSNMGEFISVVDLAIDRGVLCHREVFNFREMVSSSLRRSVIADRFEQVYES